MDAFDSRPERSAIATCFHLSRTIVNAPTMPRRRGYPLPNATPLGRRNRIRCSQRLRSSLPKRPTPQPIYDDPASELTRRAWDAVQDECEQCSDDSPLYMATLIRRVSEHYLTQARLLEVQGFEDSSRSYGWAAARLEDEAHDLELLAAGKLPIR